MKRIHFFILKLPFIIVVVIIIFSISMSFNKYVIKKDYWLIDKVSCLDTEYSCFSVDDNRYKYVYKKAYAVAVCDPYTNCVELSCDEWEDESICFEEKCKELDDDCEENI